MALRVVDSSGAAVPLLASATSPELHHSSLSLSLDHLQGPLTILTAIITQGDCTGCDPETSDPEGSAMALIGRCPIWATHILCPSTHSLCARPQCVRTRAPTTQHKTVLLTI